MTDEALFGSPRWNASPIVRLRRVRDRLLLECGTLPRSLRRWGLSWGLVFAR
jgi:hypothetical protein